MAKEMRRSCSSDRKRFCRSCTNYCPGCSHGIVHRLVAEAIDELGVEGKTIGVAPGGLRGVWPTTTSIAI